MFCIKNSLILNRKHPSYSNYIKKFHIEKIFYKNGIFTFYLGKSNKSQYLIKNKFTNYFNSFDDNTYATPEYYKKNLKCIEVDILYKCKCKYKDIELKSYKIVINIQNEKTYFLNLKNISNNLVQMYNTKYNCFDFHYGRHILYANKLSLYIDIYPYFQYADLDILSSTYVLSEIKTHIKNIIKNNIYDNS
jgi:hypothetical protein